MLSFSITFFHAMDHPFVLYNSAITRENDRLNGGETSFLGQRHEPPGTQIRFWHFCHPTNRDPPSDNLREIGFNCAYLGFLPPAFDQKLNDVSSLRAHQMNALGAYNAGLFHIFQYTTN